MKHYIIWLLVIACSLPALGQTTLPNLGLVQLPHSAPNWDTQTNTNWALVDAGAIIKNPPGSVDQTINGKLIINNLNVAGLSGGLNVCTDVSKNLTTVGCTVGGSGTVTHTAGLLTINSVMLGNGGADSTVSAFDSNSTHALFATAGAPAFRAIVSGDIPTLNQNTSGTAANLSGTPSLPNGTTATTQALSDNTNKLATNLFVMNQYSAPGAIGSATPNTGVFTNLTATNFATNSGATGIYGVSGSVSGMCTWTTQNASTTSSFDCPVQTTPNTYASLPVCSSTTEGSLRAVTDSNTVTWGATVAGGSSSHVMAYCDGTNWTVAAK